jgi:UDP-glucose 4-epimerase
LLGNSAVKCFVTGGAGFIGSHLVDRLMAEGNCVTVFDNFSVGKMEFIKQHIKNKKFKLIQADLLDLAILKKSIIGHDVVFHLAANPEARLGIENTEKQSLLTTYLNQ